MSEDAYSRLFASTPVTELRNELCSNLDGALDPASFLRILSCCDASIFNGWRFLPSMFDGAIVDCINTATKCITAVISEVQKGRDMCIVFTGCGTSGRIAYLVSKHMNAVLQSHNMKECFHYAIAGGDSALLLSDELPEDDPTIGRNDLQCIFDAHGSDGGYFIGITCGLSAPYVAGQWDFLISHQKRFRTQSLYGGSVIGFNPVSLARNAPIRNLENGMSFRDLLLQSKPIMAASSLNNNPWSMLTCLNPIVGPEPVAGSSRMKGGSATLIILDVICSISIHGVLDSGSASPLVLKRLLHYQQCHSVTYNQCFDNLPHIMNTSAASLRNGGCIYYIGTGEAAAMGCIDISEMPDTYGSPFDQMRGFIEGGWTGLGNAAGDISHKSPLHRVSIKDFNENILPRISGRDTLLALVSDNCNISDAVQHSLLEAVKRGAVCHIVACVNTNAPMTGALTTLLHAINGYFVKVQNTSYSMENIFALKLLLNAISTYAQALGRGAIYQGLMITTGPANDKIYHRCVGLISDIGGVTVQDAENALLKSIYGVDNVSCEIRNKPTVEHIKASILPEERRNEPQVILPVALLVATGRWRVAEARELLSTEPNVSVHIDSLSVKAKDSTKYAVGIDIGGSNIRAAIVDCRDGTIHRYARRDVTSGDRSADAILKAIQVLYDDMISAQCHVCEGTCDVSNVSELGVGQPGEVLADGSIANLANYSWSDPVPLQASLQAHTNKNVHLFADAQAALTAELYFGAGKKYQRVVMLTIGTGIGTALSINGQHYYGSRGLIEGGHMIIDVDGLECPCGQSGCLEMYASGPALVRHAVAALQKSDAPSILRHIEHLTAKDVVEAASKSDLIAVSALSVASKYVALGCINLMRVCDVDAIILAGSLAHAMLCEVQQHYKNLSWRLHDDLKEVPICVAECTEPGVIGAALLACEKR